MAEPTRGLLDTSVVIDHDLIDPTLLPEESAIAAMTLAELAAGPHATENKEERARRQDRLQWATATWDPLPFDADAADRLAARARPSRVPAEHANDDVPGNHLIDDPVEVAPLWVERVLEEISLERASC